MSTKSRLSRDMSENIRHCLGKNVRVLLKCMVKMECKSDKTENRILAFSACRLFVLTTKVPTKLDFHFHYLDIQSVESKKPNQLILLVHDKTHTFYSVEEGSGEVDSMILNLASAVKNIFPSVPLDHIIRKIEVVPAKRMQALEDAPNVNLGSDVGPCGGFSTQYACMCDYHGLPYREEVAWDVDTIYLSHDTKELCLKDFDHLDQKDLVPIISALEYNTWFKKLSVNNIKLSHEAQERLLVILKKSYSVEEIHMENSGIKPEFLHKFSLAVIANNYTALHTINFSNNNLEDKGCFSLSGVLAKLGQGAQHLSGPIAKVPKGLVNLNLSHCNLTSKGINHLCHSLYLNKFMSGSLTHLNLSHNVLKDDVSNLYNFLAQPNSISHLDLSATDCVLDGVFGALQRGCYSNLSHLNLSCNSFNVKKGKEIPQAFKQFFSSCLSLKYVNLACCKLTSEALKNLLLGLACNEISCDVELDISNNNLSAPGAHVLESCIHGVKCLGSLDLADNALEGDLAGVIASISKNKSLKRVNLGRNISNFKAKYITNIIESLVQLVQEDESVLQWLSLADSKLKAFMYSFINALGSNQSLCYLDISGNQIGDPGARLLAKALQINNKLTTLILDQNNITPMGYQDICYALESNRSVKYIPYPIYDILPFMKTQPEKTELLMRKIQDLLQKNIFPNRFSNSQAFRLQQGFLASTSQHMIDKLVGQIQDAVRNARQENSDSKELEAAEGLIFDADRCKQLFNRLHDDLMRREEQGHPVDLKFQQMSRDLHSSVNDYLNDCVDSMLQCASSHCFHVMSNDKIQEDIRQTCLLKCRVSPEFINYCVVEQAGSLLANKVNEITSLVAAHLTDRILNEVVESLSRIASTLLGDSLSGKQVTPPDVLRTRGFHMGSFLSRNDRSDSQSGGGSDGMAQKSCDSSPLATPQLPHSKRKSLHNRKLRPQSVVDIVEGIGAADIPDLLPSLILGNDEAVDIVSELPSSSGQLQHLGKARPKRSKTRAPSKSILRTSELFEDEQDFQDGIDTFFKAAGSEPGTPFIMTPLSDECGRMNISSSADSSPSHSVCSSMETRHQYDQRFLDLQDSRQKASSESNIAAQVEKKERSSVMKGISNMLSKITSSDKSRPRLNSNDTDCNIMERSFIVTRNKPDDEELSKKRMNARSNGNLFDKNKPERRNTNDATFEERRRAMEKISDHCDENITKSPSIKCSETGSNGSLSGKLNLSSKLKPPPPIAPKPRPKSMAGLDSHQSGDYDCNSDHSSPITSATNTPDSGDTLDQSTDSLDVVTDRKSVKELAANIIKSQESTPPNSLGRKSSSLPRNTPASVLADERYTSLVSEIASRVKKQTISPQCEDLKPSSVDDTGDDHDDDIKSSSLMELSDEDVVNV